MGAKNGELEAESRDGALETGRHLGDDLPEARRIDLEAGHEVGQQLDKWFGVAVESTSRKHEGLKVVVLRGERLDLGRRADSPADGGDARGDLRIVLTGCAALGERTAEQR